MKLKLAEFTTQKFVQLPTNCHLSRGVLIFNKTNIFRLGLLSILPARQHNSHFLRAQALAQKLWQWIKFYVEIVRAVYAQRYINFIEGSCRLVWIFIDHNSMISLISVRIITLTVRADMYLMLGDVEAIWRSRKRSTPFSSFARDFRKSVYAEW